MFRLQLLLQLFPRQDSWLEIVLWMYVRLMLLPLYIYFKLLIIHFLSTFSRVGYFQHTIWFIEYPWVDINSLIFFENNKLQTYEPVSIQSSYYVVCVLKNRMVRSAVPPPDASNPWRCGDHASAFTAAWCCENFANGLSLPSLQTNNLLSFPPEAS